MKEFLCRVELTKDDKPPEKHELNRIRNNQETVSYFRDVFFNQQ